MVNLQVAAFQLAAICLGAQVLQGAGKTGKPKPVFCDMTAAVPKLAKCVEQPGLTEVLTMQCRNNIIDCRMMARQIYAKALYKCMQKDPGLTASGGACAVYYGPLHGITVATSQSRKNMITKRMVADALNVGFGSELQACKALSTKVSISTCEAAANTDAQAVAGKVGMSDMKKIAKEAADKAAGMSIRKCFEKATTKAAKDACEATEMGKMGKTKRDIHKIAKKSMEDAIKDKIMDCLLAGNDPKICHDKTALKTIIKSGGVDTSADSAVKKALKNAAARGMRDFMKLCDKSGSAANAKKCQDEAIDHYGKIMGRVPTKWEAKDGFFDGMKEDIGDMMANCMKTGAKDKKICADSLRGMVKDEAALTKQPKGTKVHKMLEDYINSCMQELPALCKGKTALECQTMKTDCVTKVGAGDGTGGVGDTKLRVASRKAALDAAAKEVLACYQIKKDDPAATCGDPLTIYTDKAMLDARRVADPKKAAAMLKRAREEIAKHAMIKANRFCFDEDTEQDVKDCRASTKGVRAAIWNILDPMMTIVQDQAKKTKSDQLEADKETLASEFKLCNEAGEPDCAQRLKMLKAAMGFRGDATIVEIRAQPVMDLVEACLSIQADDEASGCDDMDKEDYVRKEAQKMKMKPREWKQLWKLGVKKAAGKRYAQCKSDGGNDIDCEGEVKDMKAKMQGVTVPELTDPAIWMPEVKRLARLFHDGKEVQTVFTPAVEYTASSSDQCYKTYMPELRKKIGAMFQSAKFSKVTDKGSQKTRSGCDYSLDIDDQKAVDMLPSLDSAKPTPAPTRRLSLSAATITAEYAAQAVMQCAADDPICRSTMTPTASPGGPGGTSMPATLVCTTVPADVCTTPKNPDVTPELCVYDPACKAGGLGCDAGGKGMECRYCGFAHFNDCPGIARPSPPPVPCSKTPYAVCTRNTTQLCYLDTSCESFPPTWGGLGCNAGGKGQACRFCGFDYFPPCPRLLREVDQYL